MTFNPIKYFQNLFTGAKKLATRAFVAAQMNRLTGDWNATTISIIQDIRTQGKALRARARELVQNNDIAKRYVNLVRTNVVGNNGFTLQVKSKLITGEPDEKTNTDIEEKFIDWCKPQHCTVVGTMSFRGVQDLLMTYMPRDGEVLVRMVVDPATKYGMQLQIIPPEYLDEQFNKELERNADGSQNFIRMGIEYNNFGKPLAYHIRKQTASNNIWGNQDLGNFERIPARDIIHLMLPEYANQGRGYSWMAQSMMHMRMLHGYEDATLVNARVTAAKAMYWYNENGETAPQGYTGDTKDAAGNNLSSIEPGMVDIGPPGYKPFALAPEFPSNNHEMFIRSTLRSIASGLNVSYNMLANDLVGVNYSSIRAGLLDEREMWKVMQQWFIENSLDRIFERWLQMAMFKQIVKVSDNDFERVNKPTWFGRTWAWVDPMRDIEAKILEVAAGFGTSNDVLGEKGKDLVETYNQLKKEQDLAKSLGLNLKVNETAPPAQLAAPKSEPDQENAADDAAETDETDDNLDESKRAQQIKQLTRIRDAANMALVTLAPTNGHSKH